MDNRKQDDGQMITALRDGLHGLHLARMALVGEARALRLAGRKAEREKVWARVEELTAQIEVSNRELAEHMLRSGEETQRRGDAEARWTANLPDAREAVRGQEAEMPLLRDPDAEMPDDGFHVIAVTDDETESVVLAYHDGGAWYEVDDCAEEMTGSVVGWCWQDEAAEALRKAVRGKCNEKENGNERN